MVTGEDKVSNTEPKLRDGALLDQDLQSQSSSEDGNRAPAPKVPTRMDLSLVQKVAPYGLSSLCSSPFLHCLSAAGSVLTSALSPAVSAVPVQPRPLPRQWENPDPLQHPLNGREKEKNEVS